MGFVDLGFSAALFLSLRSLGSHTARNVRTFTLLFLQLLGWKAANAPSDNGGVQPGDFSPRSIASIFRLLQAATPGRQSGVSLSGRAGIRERAEMEISGVQR